MVCELYLSKGERQAEDTCGLCGVSGKVLNFSDTHVPNRKSGADHVPRGLFDIKLDMRHLPRDRAQ